MAVNTILAVNVLDIEQEVYSDASGRYELNGQQSDRVQHQSERQNDENPFQLPFIVKTAFGEHVHKKDATSIQIMKAVRDTILQ